MNELFKFSLYSRQIAKFVSQRMCALKLNMPQQFMKSFMKLIQKQRDSKTTSSARYAIMSVNHAPLLQIHFHKITSKKKEKRKKLHVKVNFHQLNRKHLIQQIKHFSSSSFKHFSNFADSICFNLDFKRISGGAAWGYINAFTSRNSTATNI